MLNKNKLIILITFLILSIYNHTFNIIRPTEIVMPAVLMLLLIDINSITRYLISFSIVISYIFLVFLFSDTITLQGLHRIQYYFYVFIFFALSKIFIEINIFKYKKQILRAFIFSILFIIVIYCLNFLKFKPTLKFFSGFDMEIINKDFHNSRVPGVSFSIIFLGIILFYIYKVSLKYHIFLVVSSTLFFYFNSSRQVFITFILTYIFLFIKQKYIYTGLFVLIISYSGLLTIATKISKIDNPFAERTAELIYFYKSPSFAVRLIDSQQVIKKMIENNTLLYGDGTGTVYHLIRKSKKMNYQEGKIDEDGNKSVYTGHGSDNSFILLMIDGGFILLIFFLLIFIIFYFQIKKFDTRLSNVFLITILVNGMLSKHLITNYILVFILGFIYFFSVLPINKIYLQQYYNKMIK